MDFKALLLEADRNQKEFVKQSKQIKRLNTNFTTPAPKEKMNRPRSEAIQKLLDEKQAEERQKKAAEERKQRQKEKAREEREKEEQQKNTFRIPKKTAPDSPPSDAESFSSISSGDEAKLTSSGAATKKHSSHHGAHRSSAAHADSDKSHKSSSREHSEKKERDSHRSSSSHSHSEKKDKHSHKGSSHQHGEKTDRHSHKSSSHEHAGKTEKPSHKSSEHSSSSSHSNSKHRSSEHSSRSESHHRSKSNDSKHHSDRHEHSSEKRDSGSSKTHHGASEKDKSHSSSGHSKTSGQNSPKYRHIELNNKRIVIEDKALIVADNDSSGYITSPDISSEEEDNIPAPPVSKPHAGHTRTGNHSNSVAIKQRSDSTESKEEGAPVTLTRHHLKPNKERVGGNCLERLKMLEKLRSIQKRNEDDDPGPVRKRSAWGEVKKRRSKREKLDGDFTGSCMEKMDYDEEEKPSLKRPEPRPDEPREKTVQRKRPKLEKLKDNKPFVTERHSGSKGSSKLNRFDEMHEKPKIRPKPAPRPPPLGFAELMKLAEKKQTEAVMVDVAPKKEKERRPLTQEELDRKEAREKRCKTKDYKDWYLHGNAAHAKKKEGEKSESQSGGFLRPSHDVAPPKSGPKPFAIPRKGDNPSSARVDKHPSSTVTNHSPEAHKSAGHSVPVPKSKPHPTRPGMIANKPQAMEERMNSERRSEAARPSVKEREKVPSSRGPSSQPQPKPSGSASVDRTREGNAWDRLFTRPEYSRMKEAPASKKRKQVIDSEDEDEDDYEDEYDEDMDDFIDDEGEEGADSVSSVIQQLFRYDRKRYRDEDDDDRNMEASFKDVMKEEARSARIGRQEDLEDIRREEEEKKMMQKMRKMKGK